MTSSISEAFKKLDVGNHAELSQHEHIYTVSYEYLSKIKKFNDLKGFQNCLIALINMDKYSKAVELIAKIPSQFMESLLLEVGYVYYKVGKSDELIKLYSQYETIDNPGLRLAMNHVLAQNYYKIGQYQKSLDLYFQLITNNQYDSMLDLVVNERAVISQINFNQHSDLSSQHKLDSDNYDMLLNESLIELSKHNYSSSLSHLLRAETICNEQNSTASSEDLLNELLPIKLTQSYVYQMQGHNDKALQILQHYDLQQINDDMLKLIIKNNIYSIDLQSTNLNMVDRDLKYQENLSKLSQKLTRFQYQVITKNSTLLKFATGSLNKIRNSFVKEYLCDFPGDLFPYVYQIFLKLEIDFDDLNTESELKTVSRKLLRFLRKDIDDANTTFNNHTLVALMLLVFITNKTKEFSQALLLLSEQVKLNLQEEKVNPALVGTLLNMYEETRNVETYNLMETLLKKFIETNDDVISKDLSYYNFIKTICFRSLDYSCTFEETKEVFQRLHNINPKDEVVSSVLNGSADSLLPVDDLTESAKDIDQLLATDVDSLVPTVTIRNQGKANVRRKNKARFGKNKVMVPKDELVLDEERWLPLRLRSYYKPTKKDKKKVGGHQGALEVTPGPSPAASTATSSSSSKNKKKKKGKK